MKTQMIQTMKRQAARKFAVARHAYRSGGNKAVLRGEIDEARWAWRLARNELKVL